MMSQSIFKKFGLFLAGWILLSCLAACGGGNDDEDITAPSLTIDPIPDKTTTMVPFIGGSVEAGAIVEVTVGSQTLPADNVTVTGESWKADTKTDTKTFWVPGPNLVTVQATDKAGNHVTRSFVQTYDALSIESYVSPIPGTAEVIGGLFDPGFSVNGGAVIPTVSINGDPSVDVDVSGDVWTFAVTGLTSGANNTLTVSLATGDPDVGTVERTLTINVNANAPTVSIDQQFTDIVFPSQALSGNVSVDTPAFTVLPLPVSGPTVAAGTGGWTAIVDGLVPGKNTITASATANNVTATARSLLRFSRELPLVRDADPYAGASGVAVGASIKVVFATDMDPSTITTTSFTLSDGSSVSAEVTYDAASRTATLVPSSDLTAGTTYTATLTTGIKDNSSPPVPLPQSLSWSFTTAP